MHSHILLANELGMVMNDPTEWTARLHAVLSSNLNPEKLPAVETFPLKEVTHDPKDGYGVVIGDRFLTYKSGFMELHHNGGIKPSMEKIYRVGLMYVPMPGDDGMGGQRRDPVTLCVEFVHEARRRASEERVKEARRVQHERVTAETAACQARRAEDMRKMAAKLVPPLEHRLVGKRITSIGVDDGMLVITCEDGTELKVRTYDHRAIECGDIEISDLASSHAEVRLRTT